MHDLNIIHGDIKTENIMWSETYKRNVFVDFGCSRLLSEKIGEKTFTYYFGTLGYSSKEMN